MHKQVNQMQLQRPARNCGQIVPSASAGVHVCTRIEGHDGAHACACGANWHEDLPVVESSPGQRIDTNQPPEQRDYTPARQTLTPAPVAMDP